MVQDFHWCYMGYIPDIGVSLSKNKLQQLFTFFKASIQIFRMYTESSTMIMCSTIGILTDANIDFNYALSQ